ncbi:hypothetical protein [Mycobacterium sp. M26]|uniref:hypothetical protein n=1 Tax=Mycobacterium sp. M26 TaxID=1762962 RepID=UPI000AD2CCFB|nr:hypothetical protein [Mycobacterium sp. M26]
MGRVARTSGFDDRSNWRTVIAFVMCFVALAVSGCGSSSGGGQGATHSGEANPDDAICAAAKKEAAKPDALLVSLVVDRTASARTDLKQPPDLAATVAKVQEKGLTEHKGSQIQTVAVSGSSEFPPISPPLNLDPRPTDTSQNADSVRAKILNDCVPGLLASDGESPKGSNTDLIGALLAAQQQKPAEILVISSGLNSSPVIDLRTPPTDPSTAATSVKAQVPDFANWSIPVIWYNLGEPNPPLSAEDRDRTIAFWKELLGDKLTIDTRE